MAEFEAVFKLFESEYLAEEVFKAESAYKSFPLEGWNVDTFKEFESLVNGFSGHLFQSLYNMEVSAEEAEDLGPQLLKKAFPNPGDAFRKVKGSYEGGLLGVLKKIALSYQAEEYVKKALSSPGVDIENWDERIALAAAYINKFRSSLPSDTVPASPEMLARRPELEMAFEKLLEMEQKGLLH